MYCTFTMQPGGCMQPTMPLCTASGKTAFAMHNVSVQATLGHAESFCWLPVESFTFNDMLTANQIKVHLL